MNSQDRPLRTSTFLPFAFCLQCVSNEDNLLMHACGAAARGFSAICRRGEDEAWAAGGVPASPVLGLRPPQIMWYGGCDALNTDTVLSIWWQNSLGLYFFAVSAIYGCLRWGAMGQEGCSLCRGNEPKIQHMSSWAGVHMETWQSPASSL